MKNKILTILVIILAILTVLFSWCFYIRIRMNYNSEGNYFDKETLIVYDEQAIIVYALIAFIFLTLTLLTAFKLKSIKRNK